MKNSTPPTASSTSDSSQPSPPRRANTSPPSDADALPGTPAPVAEPGPNAAYDYHFNPDERTQTQRFERIVYLLDQRRYKDAATICFEGIAAEYNKPIQP